MMNIFGIHHVTSLASDPQQNVDFYTTFLGLRLVKQTVNFDAPDVYHLYYGDEIGRPGTILSFFAFPDAERGKRGTGEASAVAFEIPDGSIEFWIQRLSRKGISFLGPEKRFEQEAISFDDPDGMRVELLQFGPLVLSTGWPSSVDKRFAIRRLHSVTLTHRTVTPTSTFLTEGLGFTALGTEGLRHRYSSPGADQEVLIDIVESPSAPAARQSAGSIHHVAWRAKTESEQLQWRQALQDKGVTPTQLIDRRYFHSIYFHEPGGVLMEIATDSPGFLVDEPANSLGSHLQLPPWLEPRRSVLMRHLPPLKNSAEGAKESA
jgi:glyoxalase family protein